MHFSLVKKLMPIVILIAKYIHLVVVIILCVLEVLLPCNKKWVNVKLVSQPCLFKAYMDCSN